MFSGLIETFLRKPADWTPSESESDDDEIMNEETREGQPITDDAGSGPQGIVISKGYSASGKEPRIFSRSKNCQGVLEIFREFFIFASCQGILLWRFNFSKNN